MSYDEGDGGSRQYNNNRRGGYGGRGGGRGRGGYDKPNRRQLSPEATAVNEALAASTTWRQLNTVLEQQVWRGACRAQEAWGLAAADAQLHSCVQAVRPVEQTASGSAAVLTAHGLHAVCPSS